MQESLDAERKAAAATAVALDSTRSQYKAALQQLDKQVGEGPRVWQD